MSDSDGAGNAGRGQARVGGEVSGAGDGGLSAGISPVCPTSCVAGTFASAGTAASTRAANGDTDGGAKGLPARTAWLAEKRPCARCCPSGAGAWSASRASAGIVCADGFTLPGKSARGSGAAGTETTGMTLFAASNNDCTRHVGLMPSSGRRGEEMPASGLPPASIAPADKGTSPCGSTMPLSAFSMALVCGSGEEKGDDAGDGISLSGTDGDETATSFVCACAREGLLTSGIKTPNNIASNCRLLTALNQRRYIATSQALKWQP